MISYVRSLVAVGALAVLAACSTSSLPSGSTPDKLDIRSVTVDASGLAKPVEGRENRYTHAQVKNDVTAAVTKELRAKSVAGGTPANVNITLSSVKLAPPTNRVVGATSAVVALLQVTNAESGKVIVPTVDVVGNSDNIRAAGVIGLATTVSVEKDYKGTVDGFAATVAKLLFGTAK